MIFVQQIRIKHQQLKLLNFSSYSNILETSTKYLYRQPNIQTNDKNKINYVCCELFARVSAVAWGVCVCVCVFICVNFVVDFTLHTFVKYYFLVFEEYAH